MIAGFTGTQLGMTEGQVKYLREMLIKYKATEIHLGDCIGADTQAYHVALELGLGKVGHPPTNRTKRSLLNYDEELGPLPYLVRNRAIVAACDLLLVAPKANHEELHSGTWATWRYAQNIDVPTCIIER